MIFASVEHTHRYSNVGPGIATALTFINDVDSSAFYPHKEEIQGSKVFASFHDTTTKPAEGRYFEAHRTYIDVQFIVSGEEVIRVTDVSPLTETVPYDAERDIAFYKQAPGNDMHLRPGDFVILFPEDAHLPLIPVGAPGPVRKVVVKVKV